jgi:PEP-CTERM/exosortase A-associated glycosyltransferase
VVYEVRALWEDAASTDGGWSVPGLRYRVTKLLETHALRRADAVTTICHGLRDELRARGIPSEKITIIPNAVDRDAFTGPGAPDRALAARLGLVGKTVLGFFGSFYFYEGLHLLLRALPVLLRCQANIAVLFVGGGPEEAKLRVMTHNLGLEGLVVFTGRVMHENMQRYYDLADLLIFPRISMRLTELVTPLKPLEAMAQGRIVIASNVGGHRELIRDRETGYLFPPDDPQRLAEGILAALADRPSWPGICARAMEYVDAERSWEHVVARYDEVYRRVLQP